MRDLGSNREIKIKIYRRKKSRRNALTVKHVEKKRKPVNPHTLKPLQFKQACAMAKAIIVEDSTIDNLEWQERIKDRLIRLGFTYPEDPECLHRAMSAVDRLIERPPPRLRPPSQPKPERLKEIPTLEGLARRDDILAKMRAIIAGKTMPRVHGATDTLAQIQSERLEQFAHRKPTHRKTAKGWVPLR